MSFLLAFGVLVMSAAAADEVTIGGYHPDYFLKGKPLNSDWVVSFPNAPGNMTIVVEYDKNIDLISVSIVGPRKAGNVDIPGTKWLVTAKVKGSVQTMSFFLDVPLEDYAIIWNPRSKEKLEEMTKALGTRAL